MAVLVNQLQKDIRATRSAAHDTMKKVWALEEELQAAEVSLLGSRSALQAVMMEAGSLKAKSKALNDMVKARETQMCTTADRMQSELAMKKVRELAMKDACQRLRCEEWRLQNLRCCFDHNTQMLLGFDCSIDKKGSIENSRWGDNTLCKLKQAQKQPDKLRLDKAHESEKSTEMEARIAEAALEEVCRMQVQAKSLMELRLGCNEEARKAAEGEIMSLQERLSKACARNAEKSARIASTLASLTWSEQQTEDEDNATDILKKRRREDEIELAFIHKQSHELTMQTVSIDESILGTHLEELRGMVQWRRLAVVSPIFGAWLVTAWNLIVEAFGH